METPEGGWRSLPEVILVVFPPPIFSSGSRQTLYFGVFDLYATSLRDPQGDPFIVGFRSRRSHMDKIDGIGATRGERACPMQLGNLTMWELLVCILLGSWSPSLAHSVCLKNSELCSLTLPFLESRSSRKVQNTKKDI
jgi:hypothetical protein